MAKKITGIEIGSNQVKMTQCMGNRVLRMEAEQLPDNYVREGNIVSPEAMTEFLKEMAKKHHFTDKECAVVLPDGVAFTRRMTMPAMTIDQLKLNLPYEFHDFISDNKERYIYDYAVLSMQTAENGTPVSMDLMAAAASKDTMKDYEDMCRRAGFKLTMAAPEIFAYSNIIREYEARNHIEEKKEYCFIDLGHHATRMHIFSGPAFEVTREIEYGCQVLDEAISQEKNVDIHIAHAHLIQNFEDAWELESVSGVYDTIAIELMRAINFYSFNNPESALDTVYFCGGGSLIEPLVKAITDQISLEQHPIKELFPDTDDLPEHVCICPTAIGITYL